MNARGSRSAILKSPRVARASKDARLWAAALRGSHRSGLTVTGKGTD
jgi:hypothetical protein